MAKLCSPRFFCLWWKDFLCFHFLCLLVCLSSCIFLLCVFCALVRILSHKLFLLLSKFCLVVCAEIKSTRKWQQLMAWKATWLLLQQFKVKSSVSIFAFKRRASKKFLLSLPLYNTTGSTFVCALFKISTRPRSFAYISTVPYFPDYERFLHELNYFHLL